MSELFVQRTNLFDRSPAIAHVVMLWACSMNAEFCVTGRVQGFPVPPVYMLPMASPVRGQYWPLASALPYTVELRRPWIMTPVAKRDLQSTLRHEAAHAVKDILGEPPWIWNGSEWVDNNAHEPRECFF